MAEAPHVCSDQSLNLTRLFSIVFASHSWDLMKPMGHHWVMLLSAVNYCTQRADFHPFMTAMPGALWAARLWLDIWPLPFAEASGLNLTSPNGVM